MDKNVMLFRKGLSTVVETTLEGIAKKPFTHFLNNAMSVIKTVQNADQFAKEAYYAQQNGMIDELKAEMKKWYSDNGYDKGIVEIVVNQITDMVFVTIGGTYQMVEDIRVYQSESKEILK